jgi:hypothetical protein
MAKLLQSDGGALTLVHDFDRANKATDTLVIDSVRSVLSMSKENGIPVMTVSDFLNKAG